MAAQKSYDGSPMRRGGYQNPTTKRKPEYDEDPQMLYYASNQKANPSMMHPHPGNSGVMMHSHSGPMDPFSVQMGYPCITLALVMLCVLILIATAHMAMNMGAQPSHLQSSVMQPRIPRSTGQMMQPMAPSGMPGPSPNQPYGPSSSMSPNYMQADPSMGMMKGGGMNPSQMQYGQNMQKFPTVSKPPPGIKTPPLPAPAPAPSSAPVSRELPKAKPVSAMDRSPFDFSDFPALPGTSPSVMEPLDKASPLPSSEFSLGKEDFPALPGQKASSTSDSNRAHTSDQRPKISSSSTPSSTPMPDSYPPPSVGFSNGMYHTKMSHGNPSPSIPSVTSPSLQSAPHPSGTFMQSNTGYSQQPPMVRNPVHNSYDQTFPQLPHSQSSSLNPSVQSQQFSRSAQQPNQQQGQSQLQGQQTTQQTQTQIQTMSQTPSQSQSQPAPSAPVAPASHLSQSHTPSNPPPAASPMHVAPPSRSTAPSPSLLPTSTDQSLKATGRGEPTSSLSPPSVTSAPTLSPVSLSPSPSPILSAVPSAPEAKESGVHDQYGLIGLRSVIRMTNQDLNTLALGLDLTTLGLNLNSPARLYPNFYSPLSDKPIRTELESFKIPSCYYVSIAPPRTKISMLSDESLMYIFYNMPKDAMQLLAANELFRRRWSYHKELQRWLIPASHEPDFKGNGFERGTYFLFDPNVWEKVRKTNFVVSYDALERPQGGGVNAPVQSQNLTPQQQQQQQQQLGQQGSIGPQGHLSASH